MNVNSSRLQQLLLLSHELGREDRRLAILGEGNTSVRTGDNTFIVKASGSCLATLDPAGTAECHAGRLLALLDQEEASDDTVEAELYASRVDPQARKPSVEAMFHAWLLTLPGINFVGHTHPTAVNALLCTPRARDFAQRRLFPDEIVCCGPESALVPYTDPGVVLARSIRESVAALMARTGLVPRMILLENHGLIALGATPSAVIATTLMAVKAAEITLGACAAGGPRYLEPEQVRRIAARTDEHYRQKALGL
jgi:rhamnose utilization protein RhaD (predicted bifunctional aldolase and dehydrogenase)